MLRPALTDHPVGAWVGVAIVVVLTTIPAIDATRVISRSVLIAVIVGATDALRSAPTVAASS